MPTRYNGLVLDSLKWMGIKRVGNKCPPYICLFLCVLDK